jgi:hypothetical protein
LGSFSPRESGHSKLASPAILDRAAQAASCKITVELAGGEIHNLLLSVPKWKCSRSASFADRTSVPSTPRARCSVSSSAALRSPGPPGRRPSGQVVGEVLLVTPPHSSQETCALLGLVMHSMVLPQSPFLHFILATAIVHYPTQCSSHLDLAGPRHSSMEPGSTQCLAMGVRN